MTKTSYLFRIIVAVLLVLFLLIFVAVTLFITDSAFRVWDRLQQSPTWLLVSYAGGLLFLTGLLGVITWKLLFPKRKHSPQEKIRITQDDLFTRIEKAAAKGIDIRDAQKELDRLNQRKVSGEVYVAVYGSISTGKSSLIRSLLPNVQIQIGVQGGTTQRIQHYKWQSPGGDTLILADVPGTNQPGEEKTEIALAEALRAHVVIYVCDGDLTRQQFTEINQLLSLNKPTILALNKSDQFSEQDQKFIIQHLQQQFENIKNFELVQVHTGANQQVIRIMSNGNEKIENRTIQPQVEALRQALQKKIDTNLEMLDGLRDSAVFVLTSNKLNKAEQSYKIEHAKESVQKHTKRAVVGALAAVSPGTDIIIQGVLATSMVKEVCSIFDVSVRDVEIESYLNLSQSQLGKTIPLLLAIAGNGLKAFPGIGTVAGGLVHAVAYGLIFDTLGNTLIRTLENRKEFSPYPAATSFKEAISENLENRTRKYIKYALAAKNDSKDSD